MPEGSWYYDRSSAASWCTWSRWTDICSADADGRTRVHCRVKVVRPEGVAAKDSMVLGLQLVPVEPYRWF